MWCHQCREDVPALPSTDQPGLCCARCGEVIPTDSPSVSDPALDYDGWELDEQLRHIERVLQTAEPKNVEAEEIFRRKASRFDLPHAGSMSSWHVPAINPHVKREVRNTERGSLLGVLAWIALSLGTASFACGGILLGWSLVTGRQELWTIGLPVALGGQAALLVGFVLQLDRLWRDNRSAVAKLDSVDEQLHELKTAVTSSCCHTPSAIMPAVASDGNPNRPFGNFF